MKKFICGMVVFFGIIQSFAASAADWQGIWCDDAYLRALKNSNSPKAAFAASQIPALRVDMGQKTVGMLYQFHEMPEFTIQSVDASGVVTLAEPPAEIKSLVFLENENKIRLEYADYQGEAITATFTKAASDSDSENFQQTLDAYLTALVISGEYKDDAGQVYRFDGQNADWNGKKFQYSIVFDFIEFMPIDMLCETGENGICQTMYAFAARGSVLQIYEYNDDIKRIGTHLFELLKPFE